MVAWMVATMVVGLPHYDIGDSHNLGDALASDGGGEVEGGDPPPSTSADAAEVAAEPSKTDVPGDGPPKGEADVEGAAPNGVVTQSEVPGGDPRQSEVPESLMHAASLATIDQDALIDHLIKVDPSQKGLHRREREPEPLPEEKQPEPIVAPKEQELAKMPSYEEMAHAELAHPHIQRVADATKHVWANSDFKAMWDRDMAEGHWHCKRCHSACKTVKCNKWCSDNFCMDNYEDLLKARQGLGRLGFDDSQPITPAYVKTVRDANVMLHAAQTAKTDEEFTETAEKMKDVKYEQQEDYKHMGDQLKRADMVDRAAYPSRAEQDAEDKKIDQMRSDTIKQEQELANADKQETEKVIARDEGFKEAATSVKEASEALGDKDDLAGDLAQVTNAEDGTLTTDTGADADDSNKAMMTNVANVAAQVESMAVKVKAAESEAQTPVQ